MIHEKGKNALIEEQLGQSEGNVICCWYIEVSVEAPIYTSGDQSGQGLGF